MSRTWRRSKPTLPLAPRRPRALRAQAPRRRTDRTHPPHPRRLRRDLRLPRVHAVLRREGAHVGRKRVERLMRQAGLQGVSPRRPRGFTRRNPAAESAPDMVQRDFIADAPYRLWVADISLIPTGEGPWWLASIRDAFSRRIVGWHTSERADADLVLTALEYALHGRPVEPGTLIHHSDHGCQGGFNRSSQHLVISEVWDGSSSAGGRSGGAPEVEVTGASEISASYRGGVLGRNCQGASRGGSGWGYRRGAGGGHALVPAMWGHATVRSAAAFGQVPVVF
ncbi:IS3 family transposase [Streptomyces sp. MS06]|uniref:IS3 family transposase n=1 Tax=Streptomyces sp. MS06 TaxID=3385974 RepID=UPI00399FC02B